MKLKAPGTVSSLSILILATLACLLPFVAKPFHIDDPLFVWTARHIQSHPFDFYGFKVNWNGWLTSMPAATKNPPLAAYYLAVAGTLFGWSEVPLHLWFLLPAVAAIAGTWFLAWRLGANPAAAALMTLSAPVFELSSTSVMCDTMMLALWVWAVFLWLDGLERRSMARLGAAAALISACALTKYFGLSLVPLLLVYSWQSTRRVGAWLAWLLLPLLVMAFYLWFASRLYGRGLLMDAFVYASGVRVGGGLLDKCLAGLGFTGSCIIIVALLAPWLWSRRALGGWVLAMVAIGVLAASRTAVDGFSLMEDGRLNWSYLAQMSGAAAAGLSLLALAVGDWRKNRDAASTLLLLWIGGTFFFTCMVNWTVSARNILPMLPAVSILLARRLGLALDLGVGAVLRRFWTPLGISLLAALLVTWADYRQAVSARDAVAAIQQRTGASPDHLWFEGHWGFQYYMEEMGARALDRQHLRFPAGDVIVVPELNNFQFALPRERVDLWFDYEQPLLPGLAVMSAPSGAGFYSDAWGPMPFVFCQAPPDEYLVAKIK